MLNQHIYKVEADTSKTLKEYIHYVLEAQLVKIKNLSHETTMKHICKGTLEAMPFPLPPIDEQRRIVSRLASLIQEGINSGCDSHERRR